MPEALSERLPSAGAPASPVDVYTETARAFRSPAGWQPATWRGALVAACGLTALAARVALRHAGARQPVYRDPGRLARPLAREGSRLLALSWSGASAEVEATLDAAGRLGRPARLLTAAARPGAVRLPQVPAPAALRHLAFCAVLPPLLGVPAPAAAGTGHPPLERLLETLLLRGALPVVVAARGSLEGAIHTAYWRELLHRPAIRLVHPDWTHDFLWAFQRTPVPGAAFVVVPSFADLPDRRLPRVVAHLRRRGHPVHVLPAPRRAQGPIQRLLVLASAYSAVAARAGLDLDHELSLDDPSSPLSALTQTHG